MLNCSIEDHTMATVFLSYSRADFFFAELAGIKLGEAGISVWRDLSHLRAGADWRNGIEQGIAESVAVLVALSPHSAESSYVTYEWAYALGKGKSIVPIRLAACTIPPKLEVIQHLNFSNPESLPWTLLIERIREIDRESEPVPAMMTDGHADQDAAVVDAILAYLRQRGYQMVSFERLRRRVNEDLTDERLLQLIERHPTVFRKATLKEGVRGLARLVA
jgi:hypothetical protein